MIQLGLQDCASSFTKGNHTYDENDPGFKALQRCATLCNVSTFQEDSKTDKHGVPVPFKKVKVQGDGSTIEVRRNMSRVLDAVVVPPSPLPPVLKGEMWGVKRL